MIIGDLLLENKLRGLSVLNSSADLNRIVVTVESTETPDVASFLPPNTLLITTGMLYKNNQEALCELIETLNELPCAGLAIKLGRFIENLNSEVIETADKLGFPLIKIPMDMTLGDVYKQALALLWKDTNEELNYALNTQKKFSNLIMRGSNTKTILNNLCMILEKPVAIISPFGDIIEKSYGCTEIHVSEAKEIFYKYKLYENNSSFNNNNSIKKEKLNYEINYLPIKTDSDISYWLYIFNLEKDVNINTSVTLVMEQVILILNMSLHKSFYRLFNEAKLREDFIQMVIGDSREKILNISQILILGVKYGIKDCNNYSVIISEFNQNNKGDIVRNYQNEEYYIFIYNWLEKYILENYNGNVLVFSQIKDYKYIFINQGLEKITEKDMIYIHNTLKKLMKINLEFSIGNEVTEIKSLHNSYEEAIEANINGDIKELEFIKYYKPKSAIELLKAIDPQQAKKFCIHNLKSLAFPEDEMILELQRTLRIYLECNCSITETSKIMFMHRNTIKYRIKKCEEILGKDFKNQKHYFHILLSLILLENND